MSKNFYECTKTGGKIMNRKNEDGTTMTLCYDKEGKTHVKKRFKQKNNKQQTNTVITCPRQLPTNIRTQPTIESLQQLAAHFNENKFN